MKLNKIMKKADLSILIAIMIGIIVVVNFLSYQIFVRYDLTKNKEYSISRVSKESVRGLDDIVKVRLYFSKQLPSQFISLEQEVKDILDDYSTYSDGKITVESIDPTTLANPEQELGAMGIPSLQFNVMEKDKFQVVKGFLAIRIDYGDKFEVIPVVKSTYNLEYQITLVIKKLTAEEMATIGFVTSNGCWPASEMQSAYDAMKELYEVKDVDLEGSSEIPTDIDTLVIFGPQQEFSQKALDSLSSFADRGGKLMVLADGVLASDGLQANKNISNINKVLDKYGLVLNNDLVLDQSSGMASFSSGFITFTTNYPMWPKILAENFNQDFTAVSKLETLLVPWVSSITVSGQDEFNAVVLARTSKKSWVMTDNFNLDPQQRFSPSEQKSRDIAVFKDGQSPIVLVGDSEFIMDRFLNQSPDNIIFFQNLVDTLSLDNDLIEIRSKGIQDRPIKELSDSERNFIRYANIFGITIIVIAFGLFRYFMRKRNRFVDQL